MAKKLVKKRKLKLFHFLIFLCTLGILVFCAYILLNSKIKNINITGNNILSDEEILEQASLTDYPSFLLTLSWKIKKDLKKSPIIEEAIIKKSFFNVLNIKVKEYKVILETNTINEYILSNGKTLLIDQDLRVPRLVNEVKENKYKKLIKNMTTVEEDILGKISEITYVPNEYDKDRFLLYMNDGNSVYLTLTKFEMINYYNKVLTQLEGKKGILYLDSGNHFKIME